MRIIGEEECNTDIRRKLVAFCPSPVFPVAIEVTVITLMRRAELGKGHFHLYDEQFVLTSGCCRIRTWTQQYGVKEVWVYAPSVFVFEAREEHSLDCMKDTIMVSFAPVAFTEENIIPGIHL